MELWEIVIIISDNSTLIISIISLIVGAVIGYQWRKRNN